MSKCWNCGIEFTLRPEDETCSNCGKRVNFRCHCCYEWFEIEKDKLCKVCGFYVCPNCGTCGPDCQKRDWANVIKEIIPTISDEQLIKILKLIVDLKVGKKQCTCPRGVSISYAKSRIKRCFVKMKGFRIKSEQDLIVFKERFLKITDTPIGKVFTINQSREAGSYGQEYRDVFNFGVCMGKFKLVKKKFKEGEEEIEYEAFERCENGDCPKLDTKNIITKICPNKNCPMKKFEYPPNEEYCLCPECKYKSGENKGQLRKLKLHISNKDICQLPRGEFKKEEGENGGNRP